MSKINNVPARSKALVRRETRSAYLFLLPALVFFIGFVIIPMVLCLVTSFFNYTMGDFTFIGFGNYIKMFQDEIFRIALKNTILIVVVAVPTVTAFSLWVGASIYKMHAVTRSFFRCIFYLPVVTGSVAVSVVWKWMFNKYTGLFNTVLMGTGILDEKISWLGDERFALWCIIIILFTTSIGQPIVLYVAALGNVDPSQIEAAEVDGATKLQTFWKIKWPSIMPTTLYIVIITTINSFQCYALIQLLTSGGPNHSTETIMYYIYYQAFKLNQYGYGNAMGIFLAIIIAIFSAIQLKAGQSND
ncbi:MAG: sugar ABC transporter permease [Lachnospiraceae bacterium]|nr:sugar ABC transporter permease [Lachnospiraceae bacterium]